MATMEKKVKYPAAKMMPGEAPEDAGEAYGLVKNLIFDQVYKFHRRYGGEYDELVSEANLAFIKGHKQFLTGHRTGGAPYTDPYATVIRRWVWYELFDAMRTRVRRRKKARMINGEEALACLARLPGFDVVSWAVELGDDAREVVGLVLNPPPPVADVAGAKGGEPRNWRSTVRVYLREDLGWAEGRINTAFEEIRRALG